MKHFLPLIIVSLLIGSCSITKRRYNNGWHVEWHKQHHSGDETIPVVNNRSIRLAETVQTQDSVSETASNEKPTSNDPETASIAETPELVSSAADSPTLSENTPETTTVSTTLPEKMTSDDEPDEPKREVFPNSERVIPVPLAIILSILVFIVGMYLSVFVGGFLFLMISFGLSSFTVIGSLIGVFFGALMFALVWFLIFQLFNRKETKYASKRERNLHYMFYSLIIASGVGLFVWLTMMRTAW